MANRIFNIFAAMSAIAFCLVVVAWLAAASVDPRKHFVSVSRNCHFSIDFRGADARFEVFNDSSYGPYSGSIVGIARDPNGPRVSGVGDSAGIYYRRIYWPNGVWLWTLSLSLIYPLLIASGLPAVWLVRRARRSRRGFPVDARPAV
jgi:hypothetical protein